MINFSAIGAQNGTDPELATESNVIIMPRIATVEAGQTLEVPGYVEDANHKMHVSAMNNSGGIGKHYTSSEFAVNNGVLTPPVDANVQKFLVVYDRDVTSGAKLINESDKYPGTIVLIVKALAIDPCSVDTLKALYIKFPSFQISPELSLSLTTDTTVDFAGTLQADYCGGTKKVLYEMYWANDDDED